MKASFNVAVRLTEEPVFIKLTKVQFRLIPNERSWPLGDTDQEEICETDFAVDITCKVLSKTH